MVAEEFRASGGDARPRRVDVTDQEMVTATVDWANKHPAHIEVLVNGAARTNAVPLGELTEDQWDSDFDVVPKGPFLCARAALPRIIERRRGVLLNLSSVNGSRITHACP